MGREIRNVPPNWEHPRYTADNGRNPREIGHYRPLFDNDYHGACRAWLAECHQWEQHQHPAQLKDPDYYAVHCPYYWDYAGAPPDEDTHRERAWTPAEATHVQMYENVSEGTPVSPVFASRADLADWLVTEGHDRDAADSFARMGWVPSGVFVGGNFYQNVEAAAIMRREG